MPDMESGLRAAVISAVSGFALSAVINSLSVNSELGRTFPALFNLISIVSMIALIENANYWGIGYTFGWLIGVLLTIQFISPGEGALYIVVFIFYLFIKFLRFLT